ncbi:MAG: hypothetical protein R6T92_03535 [Desulfosalsimonadaceae bacterium]
MEKEKPECFGILEKVFPLSPDGLRHSPEKCMACGEKTQCLKTAIAGENRVVVEEEKLDRVYQSGRISFLERWAKKKMLHNRRTKKQSRNKT